MAYRRHSFSLSRYNAENSFDATWFDTNNVTGEDAHSIAAAAKCYNIIQLYSLAVLLDTAAM